MKRLTLWQLVFLGCILCSLICGLMYCCCPPRHPPERDFEIEELLLDVSAFPVGWSADAEGPRAPAKAPLGGLKSIERTELFFYVRGGGAVEEIHRFQSTGDAIQEFERQLGIAFFVGKYDTPWIIPLALPYQSPIADQFHFACSEQGSISMCRMIGRYEEYLVKFNTHMSPDFMTYEDLECVLQAIDERMAQYLGKGAE